MEWFRLKLSLLMLVVAVLLAALSGFSGTDLVETALVAWLLGHGAGVMAGDAAVLLCRWFRPCRCGECEAAK